MIYLHKLLPALVSPLGVIVCLIFVGLVVRRKKLIVTALIVLLITALPITGHYSWKILESTFPPKSIDKLKNYDAVVVLSGMVSGFKYEGEDYLSWGNPERLFAGIDIIKARKAQFLIFTGGQLPWDDFRPEGEILREKSVEMGVESTRIKVTGPVYNTAQEAEEVRKLINRLELEDVLLVTSSFHMPRAKLLFESNGINVEPFPVNFKALRKQLNWLYFLPSAGGFGRTSSAMREAIGRLYYRFTN